MTSVAASIYSIFKSTLSLGFLYGFCYAAMKVFMRNFIFIHISLALYLPNFMVFTCLSVQGVEVMTDLE